MIAEQYYLFTGPDGWAWCEMFFTDDQGVPQHCTLPTPYREVRRAIDALTDQHPHAVVDQLQADDIADAMRYAGAIA